MQRFLSILKNFIHCSLFLKGWRQLRKGKLEKFDFSEVFEEDKLYVWPWGKEDIMLHRWQIYSKLFYICTWYSSTHFSKY